MWFATIWERKKIQGGGYMPQVSKLQARSSQRPVFLLFFFNGLWANKGFCTFQGSFKNKKEYITNLHSSLILKFYYLDLHTKVLTSDNICLFMHVYTLNDLEGYTKNYCWCCLWGVDLSFIFTLLSSFSFFTMCLYSTYSCVCADIHIYKKIDNWPEETVE